jgi:hypothetical protein
LDNISIYNDIHLNSFVLYNTLVRIGYSMDIVGIQI